MPAEDEVLIKIAADVNQAASALTSIVTQLGVMVEQMKKVGEQAEETGEKAVTAGTQMGKAFDIVKNAVISTVRAFPAMVTAAADLGDQLGDMSKRTGVTVESLSALRYVASQSGVPFELLARNIQMFGLELQEGSKKTTDAIRKIGLSISDLKKMKPEDAFVLVMQKLREIPDAAQRTATGIAILGPKFRQISNLATEDIGAMIAKAKELGLVISEDQAKASDAFNDSLDTMNKMMEATKNKIGFAVLPALTALAEKAPQVGGAFLLLGKAALDATKVAGDLALTLGPISKGIQQVWKYTKDWTIVTKAQTVATWALNAAGKALSTTLGQVAVAIGVFLAAWELGRIIAQIFDLDTKIANLAARVRGLGDVTKETAEHQREFIDLATQRGAKGIKDYSEALKFNQAFMEKRTQALALAKTEEERLRAAQAKTMDELTAILPKAASAYDLWAAAQKAARDELNGLSAAQRQQLSTMVKADAETKLIVETMGLSTEAVELFKKSLKDLDKTPLAKLMEAAKQLAKDMATAEQAGVPLNARIDEFGKKSADIVREASMRKALKEISAETIAMADTWEKAQLAEKMEPINKKAIELSTTFSQTMKAGAMAAASAVQQMEEDMLAATLTGTEARLFQIDREEQERRKAIIAEKTEVATALADHITALKANAAETLKAERDLAIARGRVLSTEREQQLADALKAAMDAATAEADVHQAKLDTQLAASGRYYDEQRDLANGEAADVEKQAKALNLITKRVRAEELADQKKLLKFMQTNRQLFFDWEIKAQQDHVEELTEGVEKEAKRRGLVTKEQLEKEAQTARDNLAYMLANRVDFTDAAIQQGQRLVAETEKAAKGEAALWDAALSGVQSLARAFDQLASISGDTWGGMVKDIGEVIGSVNVMGEGLRGAFGEKGFGTIGKTMSDVKTATGSAFKGALAGISQIGGAVSGMIAAATAAIQIGKKLWDAFTTSAGEKAAKEVGRNFGVKISEEMGNAIAETAKKEFGGDRMAGALAHFQEILQKAGGLTTKNFSQMLGQLGNVFELVKKGSVSVEQATEILDKNFATFANHVLKTGKVASAQFQDLIRLNAESGVQSKEIIAFVESQAARVGSSLARVMGPFTKNVSEIKRLREEIAKEKDPMKLAALNKELTAVTAKVGDATTQMGRFERLAVAGFNAALKSGAGYLEAVDAMGPTLDQLVEAHKVLGTTASPAIQELLRFREVAGANKELVESAGALNEVMLALSNIGGLNVDTMADLQAQGQSTFEQLKAAGFSEAQSLQQMKGFLEQVRNAHDELGLPIDENTQKLIEQATAQGILKEKELSTNQIMMEGLSAIIKALGGDIPDAFKKMEKSAVDSATTVGKTMNDTVGVAITDTSRKLTGTPWAGYAAKGVIAGSLTAGSMRGVEGAVRNVQGSLDRTDWEGWSQEAQDAARDAQSAIDGVSFGASPGGIKEISLKLMEATRAARMWESATVGSAEEVADAINQVGVGGPRGVPRAGGAARGGGDGGGALTVNFTINALDGADVKKVVEEKVQPALIESWKRGRGISALRELVK
jgi:hypothetical protein